jgi:uncharacterized protein YjdB
MQEAGLPRIASRTTPPVRASVWSALVRFITLAAIAALGIAACDAVTSPLPQAQSAEFLDGNVRDGIVGQPLDDEVRIRVVDRWGAPVPNASVEFRVAEGGGGTVPARAQTDSEGLAATRWVLGPTAGTQRLEVRAPDGGAVLGTIQADARPGAPESVAVVPTRVSVRPGSTSQVEAWIQDGFGNAISQVDASWRSDDDRIAQIDDDGRVLGIRAGTVEIEALVELVAGANDEAVALVGMEEIVLPHHRPGHAGGKGNVDVEDEEVEAEVIITGGDGQAGEPGETLSEPLSIRVVDEQGAPIRRVDVTWSVQSGGGVLSATNTRTDGQGRTEVEWTLGSKPGEYTVEAKVADGSLGSATFVGTILEGGSNGGDDGDGTTDGGDGEPDEGTITVSPDEVVLPAIDEDVALEAEVRDRQGRTVDTSLSWTSSDPSIVAVDQDGRAVARAAGAALVVASSDCCAPDTAQILVDQVATDLRVTPEAVQLLAGGATTLEANVLDANGYVVEGAQVNWTSSDPQVAAVDDDGTVTALEPGTAHITASSDDLSDSATIEVSAEEEQGDDDEQSGDDDGPSEPAGGIWLSQAQLDALPTSGSAWNNVKDAADTDLRGGVLTERDDHNVRVMAAGLVAARLDDNRYRAKVRDALVDLMSVPLDNEDGLAVNRRLVAYVAAADLINLAAYAPSVDADFRQWLEKVRSTSFQSGGGGTIAEYHERRPNNYGTMAGASRMAVALYLDDHAEFERAMKVFRGWLGDRNAYAGFNFGSDLSWQADERAPVGINPRGATKDGRNIDGVLPDDQRRCGSFDDEPWPCTTNYSYGGLAGALAQAQILQQQGYAAFEWQDRAILRAMTWLHEVADQPADGDREWQPHLVNGIYGTSFPAPSAARPGKNVGWADWTH